MNTIITYLSKHGDKDLSEEPFNEIDSLILCQLSYLHYDAFVGSVKDEASPVAVRDIFESEDYEELFLDYWFKKDNHKLFEGFVRSKRFGETTLNFFENIISTESEAQFSAITFILPDKSVYVAFRGTDATLIGWKEDLKLAYSKPLRSQELAAGYLIDVSGTFSGPFRVGGHSKGGNLAVYATMNVPYSIRDRVMDVYDHDGPGFRPEILDQGHFEELKDRVHKYIPKSSIVGIILEEQLPYEIVESYSVGALQHNTYTWKCKDRRLVRAKGSNGIRDLSEKTLNEWILSLSKSEVDAFIDTLFDILTAGDAKSIFDIVKNPGETLSFGVSAFKDLSEETKHALFIIFKRLIGIMNENALSQFLAETHKIREKIDRQVSKLKVTNSEEEGNQ